MGVPEGEGNQFLPAVLVAAVTGPSVVPVGLVVEKVLAGGH